MTIVLREGVHLAWSGDIAVFLDLDADRYSCLGPVHSAVLRQRLGDGRAMRAGTAEAGGDEAAWSHVSVALMRAGLADDVTEARATKRRASDSPANWTPAARSVTFDARPGVFDSIFVLHARAAARRRLQRHPLRTLVDRQRRWSMRAPAGSSRRELRMMDMARAFEATKGVYEAKDKCLAEALALVSALRARRLHAHWVFGVSAPPFEAHCWVQSGDLVLNDTLDHVSRFTPILVA